MADNHFDKLLMDERIRLVTALAGSLDVDAWLVGGGLRDALMGRPVRDFDFALGGAADDLPRRFAARCGGSFFWLDRERLQSRVVVRLSGGERLTCDFASLKGDGIIEDLRLRDFTVNALALHLAGEASALVDPLGGQADVRHGVLRMCRPEAFSDDPLRLLRAFRFVATLGFKIDDRTLDAIRANPALLSRVAGERVRDELFLLLGAPGVEKSLDGLCQADLLPLVVPAIPDPAKGIALAAAVERLSGEVARLFPEDGPLLYDHLQQPAEGDIPLLSLVKLAALLAGSGWKERVDAAVTRLKLGNHARDGLKALCACLDQFPDLPGDGLAERPCYRFFHDRQPSGAELLLLPLASGVVSPHVAERLLSFYFHHYRPDAGDLLLAGDEVMALLKIRQGPGLGREMERLREAESLGLVATAGEARAFLLKNKLTKGEPMG